MSESSPARLRYALLLACVPASMLAVVWLPVPALIYLRLRRPVLHDLLDHIAPLFPSWPQYFAVQTLLSLLLVCAVWWALAGRRRGLRPFELSWAHAVPALVAAYALWGALSCLWSTWPYGSRGYLVRELPFYGLCVGAAFLVRSDPKRLLFAMIFVLSAVVQAALQAAVILGSAAANGWPLRKSFLQRAIFYSNPNYSCAILVTAALLVVGLLVSHAVRAPSAHTNEEEGEAHGTHMRRLPLVGAACALAVFGFVFVTAGALAGYLAAGAAVAAYLLCLLRMPRKGAIVAGLVLCGLLATAVGLNSARLRAQALGRSLDPESTAHVRVMYWLGAADAFESRPLAGWGVGTFNAVYPRFKPALAGKLPYTRDKRPEHPHNEFLRVASDLGVVGLALYAGIIVVALAASCAALRSRPIEVKAVGYAVWAGCLAYVVQSALGKAPMGWCFSASFWMLLGVLTGIALPEATPSSAAAGETDGRRPAWAVFIALAATGAIGWCWWAWGVGGYRSMVHMRRAEEATRPDRASPRPGGRFDRFRSEVEAARRRCLWPTKILGYDYSIAEALTRQGRWPEALAELEKLQMVAPELLATRLLMARCHLNLAQVAEAVQHAERYLDANPYDVEGYLTLANADLDLATERLEEHVDDVEGFDDPEKVLYLAGFYALQARWDAFSKLVEAADRDGRIKAADLLAGTAAFLESHRAGKQLGELRAVFPEIAPPVSATAP